MKTIIGTYVLCFMGTLIFCAKHVNTPEDEINQVNIKPSVRFMSNDTLISPDSVDVIVITLLFSGKTVSDTFKYEDHTATIDSHIPVNTPFTLRIEGLDHNGNLIYYGEKSFPGSSDDITTTIEAHEVTPKKPEDFWVKKYQPNMLLLQWKDKAKNESGFIIERSDDSGNIYFGLDTLKKDIVEFVDRHSVNVNSFYFYKLVAFNAVGLSPPEKSVYDPKEFFLTPSKPKGEQMVSLNDSYLFVTERISCGNGHQSQYRFDWGDNDISPWYSSPSAFHSWSKTGEYIIKVQARCKINIHIVSPWSPGLKVEVYDY